MTKKTINLFVAFGVFELRTINDRISFLLFPARLKNKLTKIVIKFCRCFFQGYCSARNQRLNPWTGAKLPEMMVTTSFPFDPPAPVQTPEANVPKETETTKTTSTSASAPFKWESFGNKQLNDNYQYSLELFSFDGKSLKKHMVRQCLFLKSHQACIFLKFPLTDIAFVKKQ